MTESTFLPETAISRRQLLAFSAAAIPAGALITGAATKTDPNTTPTPATRPAPVYFC